MSRRTGRHAFSDDGQAACLTCGLSRMHKNHFGHLKAKQGGECFPCRGDFPHCTPDTRTLLPAHAPHGPYDNEGTRARVVPPTTRSCPVCPPTSHTTNPRENIAGRPDHDGDVSSEHETDEETKAAAEAETEVKLPSPSSNRHMHKLDFAIRQISCGSDTTLAVTLDGSVWMWGMVRAADGATIST